MLTPDGAVLLECNARFGDPETQVVLPRLAVALGPLLLAAAQGDLLAAVRPLGLRGGLLPVTPQAAVGVVLAAAGYPGKPRAGDAITGLDQPAESGSLVFHSGTAASGDGFVTRGGRVLTVVARGADLAAARRQAESAVDLIGWDGLQRRHDIGLPADAHPELVPA
jgi:phosphoribosylamine--glycine ligase